MSSLADFAHENLSVAVSPPVDPHSLLGQLIWQPGKFEFFQAVSILERLDPLRQRVGEAAQPQNEAVRLRAALGTAFPPTAICQVTLNPPSAPQPLLTQALLGLTGPSGVLPRHYTELLHRVERDAKGLEKHALRDWFDLFNHRLASLLYRGWAKHQLAVAMARGEYLSDEPDTYTGALFSCIGMGQPTLRAKVAVRVCPPGESPPPPAGNPADDLALLRYSGLLAQRPRSAGNLTQLLRDFLQLPVIVEQFTGQWLKLEEAQQSTLGSGANESLTQAHNQLGKSSVLGSRVWDAQSKFRVTIGPLQRQEFDALLPENGLQPTRFATVCNLVRFFVGPEHDFCVRLVLRRKQIPNCELSIDPQAGVRLGWNSWMGGGSELSDAADAQFESCEEPTGAVVGHPSTGNKTQHSLYPYSQ